MIYTSPSSPDVVEKHYSADFALLLCRLIGYRKPLIDRLRDPAVKKTTAEMEYLADVLTNPNHKWPTDKQVLKRREKLERAAYYLESLYAGSKPRGKEAARATAADACGVDVSTIKRSMEYAKHLANGKWWESAEHLAKKGPRKSESLHLTY